MSDFDRVLAKLTGQPYHEGRARSQRMAGAQQEQRIRNGEAEITKQGFYRRK